MSDGPPSDALDASGFTPVLGPDAAPSSDEWFPGTLESCVSALILSSSGLVVDLGLGVELSFAGFLERWAIFGALARFLVVSSVFDLAFFSGLMVKSVPFSVVGLAFGEVSFPIIDLTGEVNVSPSELR